MYKYVLKRLLMMIPVLIGVSFLVFFILAVSPGDPTRMILGQQASEAAVQAMREELGLDHNLFVRYFDYMVDALHGDFGTSWKSQLEVLPQVLGYFPNTVILSIAGILVAILIGVPIGILSAKKQYTWVDNIATVLGLIGVAMPNFWLGLLLVMVFALNLGWLPASGAAAESDPAGFDPGHRLRGQHHAYDSFQHAGIHASGLHRYSSFQRSEGRLHH